MNELATYTRNRLVKASPRLRSVDATLSRAGLWAQGALDRGLSLLGGVYKPGWAIGIDGYTAREIDSSYEALLAQLGMNEIVYACMRERMKVLIQSAFVVERRQADGKYVVDDNHDLTAMLRRPAEHIDAPTLWRTFEASYASVGRLYIEPIIGRGLEGLNPLCPIDVREEIRNGQLIAYHWEPPDAPSIVFGPKELIVRRAVQWADVPPMIAALKAIDADSVATDYIRSFFYNNAVPSGILKVKGSWSQEKTEATRLKWWDVFTPGGTAQGAPAILDENIESYTRIGVSLNELDSQTLRTFIETRICMCFGVSPLIIYSFAGLLRAIESNLEEAWDSFWDATAMPLLSEWANWMNWSILIYYEDPLDIRLGNVRCRFDPTELPWFQEDADAKAARYGDAYDRAAVTMNEYRLAIGADERPDGDVFKAPPQPPQPYIVPPEDAPDPTEAQEQAAEDIAEKKLPLIVDSKAIPEPSHRFISEIENYLRNEYAKARRMWLAGNDQGAEAVIRQIEEELDDGTLLSGVLAPSERKAYADSFKAAARRVDYDVVLDTLAVTAAVDLLAERAVAIAQTTKDEITQAIAAGGAIASALEALRVDRSKARAPLIAGTELAHAAVTAETHAYTASGTVAGLTWLASSTACDECKALDGKTFDLGSQPALPAHPACRCSWAPITAEVLA